MAARRASGNHRLEEAMALLIQNQAAFVANQQRADERMERMNERWLRIERDLDQIKAILLRHEQMLQALPEAIREKIDFEPHQKR